MKSVIDTDFKDRLFDLVKEYFPLDDLPEGKVHAFAVELGECFGKFESSLGVVNARV